MAINSQNGNTLLQSGFFAPCRVATTGANIALAGLQTIDGVVLLAGDRVLVKNQTDATTNGIYAASTGNWVRTTDAAGNSQFFDGMAVVVAQGTTSAGQIYVCTATDDPVVVGTSALTFATQGAVQQALQQATSTSSAALTTGAKTFATQSGKSFASPQWLLIYETANPNNNLLAQVTSYTGTSLVVSVAATSGTGGPFTDWTIVLNNSPAAAGHSPPVGTGNVTGPGSSTATHLATFADTTGKVLSDSGLAAGALAGLSATTLATTGAASVGPAALAGGAGLPPFVAPQPTDNLVLSNDGTNPNTDIQISPGRAPSDEGLYWLPLAGTMLKRIDTAFAAGGAVGNRQGMLLSGSSWLASKTYHLWLIGAIGLAVTSVSRTSNVATVTIPGGHPLGAGGTIRPYGIGGGFDAHRAVITATTPTTVSYANTGTNVGATGVSAFADGFDIGATQQDAQNYPSATLPSGFTEKQCLGSILTDGSKNVIAFLQVRDEFTWITPILDVNGGTPSSPALETLSVPSGVRVFWRGIAVVAFAANSNPAATAYLTPPDVANQGAATNRHSAGANLTVGASNLTVNRSGGIVGLLTDTSARIRANTEPSAILYLTTCGWREFRRSLF